VSVAILAEKPSVARDIARVVGARRRGDGHLYGNGYVVSWAVGHLVTLPEPHQIRPEWKRWRPEALPMLPATWPLAVYPRTRDQFEVVRRILNDPEVSEVVCATDAGREGELIFRYIYEAAACRKPVRRLWISSLTESAIRTGFENLRDADQLDPLAHAARGRSRADWLVGMNLSRAYTLAYGDMLSVGRVQTPTLAMLVERELAIRSFVPEDYQEVVATFRLTGGDARASTGEDACQPTGEDARQPTDGDACYDGVYFDPTLEAASARARRAEDPADATERRLRARRLPTDGEEAVRIVERALRGRAEVRSVEARQRALPPPPLYDLTELQRHANRLYGLSATRTLELAQGLYERQKLISYPRTDSRHLSRDVEKELPGIVGAIRARYAPEQLAEGTGERPLGSRFVDDTRVSDHHAILPTANDPEEVSLGRDEARIYDLVCRRLLAAWHEDHLSSTTRVVTVVRAEVEGDDAIVDHFHSSGTRVDREGWRVLDIRREKRPARNGGAGARASSEVPGAPLDPELPSGLREGLCVDVLDARAQDKRTRPPRRFSDATLLTAMETAGRTVDEKELSDAMRKSGLGTPATRAAIIETLRKRGYIERDGTSLVATDKGIRLVEVVHPDVKSPIMTGRWEARLQNIQRGTERLDAFMKQIEAWVGDVTRRVLAAGTGPSARPTPARGALPSPAAPSSEPPLFESPPLHAYESDASPMVSAALPLERRPARPRVAAPSETAPTPPEELDALLHARFGFEGFRPHQREVCEAVTRGEDVLLVMPTGAGKSLCYQLPDRAHGGPGREAPGAGLPRRAHPLGAQSCRVASGLRRLPEGRPPLPLHRPGAAQRRGLPRDARKAEARPDRGRRGALHLAVGPRFPPGLPHAEGSAATPAAGPRRRHDGHRHPARAAGHRRAARQRADGALHPRLSSLQHRDRGGRGHSGGA
jgi:DNA topoisomerase-3